jgi:hypothetical protein
MENFKFFVFWNFFKMKIEKVMYLHGNDKTLTVSLESKTINFTYIIGVSKRLFDDRMRY